MLSTKISRPAAGIGHKSNSRHRPPRIRIASLREGFPSHPSIVAYSERFIDPPAPRFDVVASENYHARSEKPTVILNKAKALRPIFVEILRCGQNDSSHRPAFSDKAQTWEGGVFHAR